MGFLPNIGKASKYTRLDEQMAKELRSIVTSAGRMRSWSPRTWSNQFRLMREQDGLEPGQIQDVLDWYSNRVKIVTKPTIHNAKNFRTNFKWLSDLMKKDTIETSPISKEASEIVNRVKGMGWPRGSADQLPVAVETTLRSFAEFTRKLSAVCSKHPERVGNDPWVRLAWAIKRTTRSVEATEAWFREHHKRVANWSSWSGKLQPWNGDFMNQYFNSWGKALATKQGLPTKTWMVLLENLE